MAPMDRSALAAIRDQGREALSVIAESNRIVDCAVAEAAVAVEKALDESVAVELSRIPVDRLRGVSEEAGLRLGALEAAGYRTVADVLVAGPERLDLAEGVGPATAAAAHHAAQQLAVDLRREVQAMPDPDAPLPSDPQLLRSLYRVAEELKARPGLLEPAAALEARLAAPVHTLEERTRRIRWILSGGKKRDAARAAAASVQADLTTPANQQLLAGLRQAAITSTSIQVPDDAVLWQDYSVRGADYVSALERVGAGGVARPAAPRLQGGVAAEIAAAVEQQSLDLRGMTATLRGYQRFGVQYVVAQRRTILGDEMGLGKTIQALAAMCHLRGAEAATHFLVVAPASILANWVREIGERTDLGAHLLHGDDRDEACAAWRAQGGVGVTSFTTLSVLPLWAEPALAPALVVVDEAHFVKNPAAARTRAVAEVLDRAGRALLMSGTPMENRIEEFRALVDLLQPPVPVVLDAAQLLLVEGDPELFRERLSSVYLRRNQEDVLIELPERIEIDEWVALPSADSASYEASVATGDLMAMRQAATLASTTEPSAKFERLAELLEEYEIEGRKVLVFSFFRAVLDEVSRLAGGCSQITGDVPPDQRLAMVDAFSNAPGYAVLAAQIEAGGVGINLQAASVVVLMEPQFKPSVEAQAIARAHRMGQTRRVVVHRLLARDSIDEWLVELMRGKQDLFDAYARPSAVKEATMAATDLDSEAASEATIGQHAVAAERQRLGLAS